MVKPVVASFEPQAPEQQVDGAQPDAGQLPPATVPGPMTVPATTQPPTPLSGMTWQVPFWLLPVLTQFPLQHSPFAKHVSLVCKQYETVDAHFPPTQPCEQQSELLPHESPEPRQVVCSALQKPLWQRPLQHWLFDVQAAAVGASGKHAFAWQVLFEPQLPEQQSLPLAHVTPLLKHGPVKVPHTFGWLEPQTPPPGH